MIFNILRDLSRPHWFDIIVRLKNSGHLSVSDLSKSLEMSYMGVKQHCMQMKQKGFLETIINKKETGRPEILYKLTDRVNLIFPLKVNSFMMEFIDILSGVMDDLTVEKTLKVYFRNKVSSYLDNIRGSSVSEKVMSLAKLRHDDGYLSYRKVGEEGELSLVEYHNPFKLIHKRYPSILSMEEMMISEVLNCDIDYVLDKSSGPIYAEIFIKEKSI